MNRRRAFTLVELLLSLALTTGLLVTGVALAFQLAGALASDADDPVFERHAAGVERFLRAYASSAEEPSPPTEPALPCVVVTPAADAPLLTGRLRTPSRPVCRLALTPGVGLRLVWPATGATGPRTASALISPHAVAASTLRYDGNHDRWETEIAPPPAPPDRRVLRVELAHAGRRRLLWVPLAPEADSAPEGL